MRVGIYGGTFSPPHKGHTEAAKCFAKAMKLDKLMIIPTYLPPHKEFFEEATPEQRLQMCRLAFSDIDGAEISDIEIKRGGKSYTYETLRNLTGDNIELYFLLGTDMLLTLDEWKCPEEIFRLCTVCYVRRECDAENDKKISEKLSLFSEKYSARIVKIDHKIIEVSSSELRDGLTTGSASLDMLDEKVIKYINERGLYR